MIPYYLDFHPNILVRVDGGRTRMVTMWTHADTETTVVHKMTSGERVFSSVCVESEELMLS